MTRAWFGPNFNWFQFLAITPFYFVVDIKIRMCSATYLYYKILIFDVVNNRRQKVEKWMIYFKTLLSNAGIYLSFELFLFKNTKMYKNS